MHDQAPMSPHYTQRRPIDFNATLERNIVVMSFKTRFFDAWFYL